MLGRWKTVTSCLLRNCKGMFCGQILDAELVAKIWHLQILCYQRRIGHIMHVAGCRLFPESNGRSRVASWRTAHLKLFHRSPHYVSTKLLCGMRREDRSLALATVDQPEILRALFATVCKRADDSGGNHGRCIISVRPGGRTCGATPGAAAVDRTRSSFAALAHVHVAEPAEHNEWDGNGNR
jgi:hypothetical protein